MNKCKKCGRELSDGDLFCPSCGEPTSENQTKIDKDKKNKSQKTNNKNKSKDVDSKPKVEETKIDEAKDDETIVEIMTEEIKSVEQQEIDSQIKDSKQENSKPEEVKTNTYSSPDTVSKTQASQQQTNNSTYNEYEDMIRSNKTKRKWFKKKDKSQPVEQDNPQKQKNQVNPNQVVSTGGFFVNMLVLLIPVVGLIVAIIWALGGAKNNNRINMGKAYLAMFAISLVAFIACGITFISKGDTVKSVTYDIVDNSTNNFFSKHKIRSFNDFADIYYKLEHFDDFQKYVAEMDRKDQDKKDEKDEKAKEEPKQEDENKQKAEQPQNNNDNKTESQPVTPVGNQTVPSQPVPPAPTINYYYYNNPVPQNQTVAPQTN